MATAAFAPGCPWHDLHARFPPNIDWCEAKLCTLIVTPFNSWTNLAYLFAAALMWALARRADAVAVRLFAPATAITGVSSFVYHQSLNAFTQLLDFFGMYACCVLLLMANLQRMRRWPDGTRGQAWYWRSVAALTALTGVSFWLGVAAQAYVGVLIVWVIATELAQPAQSRRWFWSAIGVLGVASVLSALDLTRTICNADNHWLQLHGLWHVLTAGSIVLAFLHIRQECPPPMSGADDRSAGPASA